MINVDFKQIQKILKVIIGSCIASFLVLLLTGYQEFDIAHSTKKPMYETIEKDFAIKYSSENQKLIYGLLSPTERYNLWVSHLTKGSIQINANNEQKKIIKSIIEKFSIVSFDEELADVELYKLVKLAQEASALFGKDEYIYLFFTLDTNYKAFLNKYNNGAFVNLASLDTSVPPNRSNPNKDSSSKQSPVGKTRDCSCSTKSDACAGILSCSIADCLTSNVGCGFLWLFSCNGRCV